MLSLLTTLTTRPYCLYLSIIIYSSKSISDMNKLSSPNIKAVDVYVEPKILLKVTALIRVLPMLVFGSPDFLPYC